jgi:drug/metabolite transporter (DMT)-like permease
VEVTFVCRLEMVNIRRLHSMAKILGTTVAAGGALSMTLIKGDTLNLPWTKGRNRHDQSASAANKQDLMKGALIIIASCFCWSFFIILQVGILNPMLSHTSSFTLSSYTNQFLANTVILK